MAVSMTRPFGKICAGLAAGLFLAGCAENGAWMESSSTSAVTQNSASQSVATETVSSSAQSAAYSGTVVSRQIQQLRSDLTRLQSDVSSHGTELSSLRSQTEQNSQSYFAAVAEINARLQSGTTPGNPRLVEKWRSASSLLESFGGNVTAMNGLASKISGSASMSAFLLESTRATYNLSGAVEEDHAQLAALEDDVNRTVVQIDRVLMDLNNDIERQTAYLANERSNLQMLSLAIAHGELYGPSFSNRGYQPAMAPAMAVRPADLTGFPVTAPAPAAKKGTKPVKNYVAPANSPTVNVLGNTAPAGTMAAASTRPFVIIRFDRADIDYGQPLYQAMDKAVTANQNATFEIVAVSPAGGNPAQKALSANESRRHAEDVVRTLKQMGMPADRMSMSSAENASAKTPEVHIFLR